jgi:hypothetical protein
MSGQENLRGIDYQVTYSLFKTLNLLKRRDSVVHSIEFESIDENGEDFTIINKDETKEYVQIKKKVEGYNWTASELKAIFEKFSKKNAQNIRFSFVTNGNGNKDVIDLKTFLSKNQLPPDSHLEKFLSENLTMEDLKVLLPKTNIQTRYYSSDSDDDPAKVLRNEVIKELLSTPYFLNGDIESIYSSLWHYIFEVSRNATTKSINEIVSDFHDLGLTIAPINWFNIPDTTNFYGREDESNIFIRSLSIPHCCMLYGISGIGKSSFLAKIAERLKSDGENVCWINIDVRSSKQSILNIIIKFLEDLGIPHYNLSIKEDENCISRLKKILTNERIFLFIDSANSGNLGVDSFIEEFVKSSLSSKLKSCVIISYIDLPGFMIRMDR